MIDSVVGGITLAIPAPWRKKVAPTSQIGDCVPTRSSAPCATATRPSPTAHTALGPNLRTIAALRGANTSCATANGVISRPAPSGL